VSLYNRKDNAKVLVKQSSLPNKNNKSRGGQIIRRDSPSYDLQSFRREVVQMLKVTTTISWLCLQSWIFLAWRVCRVASPDHNFFLIKYLILGEQQYFVRDTASQITKWLGILNIFGELVPLARLWCRNCLWARGTCCVFNFTIDYKEYTGSQCMVAAYEYIGFVPTALH